MNPARNLLLATFLILAGAVISFWWAPSQILTAYAAENWPTATGKIVSAQVYDKHSKNSGTTWYTKLRYKYQVQGKTLENDTYTTAGDHSSSSRREMDAFAQLHASGTDIQVFYDPDAPATSLLAPGVHWKSWGNLGMGIILLLAGGYFLLRQLRSRG
jgi:Protein of unknown function (DUF3592)